ncbi:hypothetical protein C1645_830885 [Glomus cerebriforme]|uniref:SAM domain-containing protein n=1 Tax=Glomus cerebriforme TaxID=658196 RepID=A0A397SMQ7_9GLOM|nr:hypothetical protein C1645_830885 [Glomus cerebriforme]
MCADLNKIIEDWNTKELITFLKKQSIQRLHLDDEVFDSLSREQYSGYSFLCCDKEDLAKSGLRRGPLIEIYNFKQNIVEAKKNLSASQEPGVQKYVDEIKGKKYLSQFVGKKNICEHLLEEILLPMENWVSEMRLITKNKKPNGNFQYKFINIFVSGLSREQQETISKSNVMIELKVISIWGLYSEKRKKVERIIDYDLLRALDNELITKSENDLLKMDYCYFCSEKNNYQFVTIQTILDDALKQITSYIGLLKMITDCYHAVIKGGTRDKLRGFRGGAFFGDVYTDDKEYMFQNTVRFAYVGTTTYTSVIFLDNNDIALGNFQSLSISTCTGLSGGTGSWR